LITEGATTWTTKEETFDLYEYFCGKYGLERVTQPMCKRRVNKESGLAECGNTTCYVVEDLHVVPIRDEAGNLIKERVVWKRVGLINKRAGLGNMPAFPGLLPVVDPPILIKDNMAYLPALVCIRCGAADDGFMCGMFHPGRAEEYVGPEVLRSKPMTDEERVLYTKVFRAAYSKARSRMMAHKAKDGNKSRYMPKGKESASA
jgi:hypothetical protein